MRTRITVNHGLLVRLVRELGQGPDRVLTCIAGISRLRDTTELLVYALERDALQERAPNRVLVCSGVDTASVAVSIHRVLALTRGSPPDAVLCLGLGSRSGDVAGILRIRDSYEPLDAICLLEPGLPRAVLTLQESEGFETTPASNSDLEIWSRSIGAMGETAWRRLTELHFGVVGCGRSGMEVATSLARLGVSQITAIDGDALEVGNLGELFPGVSLETVGQSKAQVLASLLSGQTPNRLRRVTAVPESISSQPALVAVKDTDVLICCVDSATARAATAFLAKLYLRPLLDLGMGIHRAPGASSAAEGHENLTVGSDVRLVLPDRCLLCFGGIRRIEAARQAQRDLREGRQRIGQRADWRSGRAGSLRSLNIASVGLGIRFIEELVQGRRRESTWLQIDYRADGLPAFDYPIADRSPQCSMCRYTGLGDDGLDRFADAIGIEPVAGVRPGRRAVQF